MQRKKEKSKSKLNLERDTIKLYLKYYKTTQTNKQKMINNYLFFRRRKKK